jgi:hypothetical protein
MIAVSREDAAIAIEGDGAEMRTKELGQYTVAFARLAQGVDLGPALVGLPDDLCPCPHWGYMIKGRLLMRTPDGDRIYEAGQAFYWEPGHARRRWRTASTSTSPDGGLRARARPRPQRRGLTAGCAAGASLQGATPGHTGPWPPRRRRPHPRLDKKEAKQRLEAGQPASSACG